MFSINDREMYQYFDKMIYEDKGLPETWKVGNARDAYGLTDYDVHSILGAKKLFYKEQDAQQQICLLETMQKFLHDYIGIEGLEELLINNYGVIENSIFLEHDQYGNPAHIREHAKHQIKNAFLGSRLMLDYGYLSDMAKTIYSDASAVTKYLRAQAENVLIEQFERQHSRPMKTEDMEPVEWTQKVLSKLEEWSYEVFMVSSLLHDIGYPLEFYLRSARKLSDYPPYLKVLSPTIKADFAEIKAHLLGSQLFKLINHQEIRKKYERNDHGVLSAIGFLMHFYYGGRIFSLSREQKCILEMSAIAIYRHTDKFEEGFRMVYKKDPISYMVRLCDELQEWDRFKLLINDKHNYLRCENCWKILCVDEGEYKCPGCNRAYRKVTQIDNRKVNYICMCDELCLEKNDEKVKITIRFSPMKQLEILMDDYMAIIRSNKNLEKVKAFVTNQSFSPEIEIDFYVSNNPVMLIEHMIEEHGCTEADVESWIQKQTKKRRANMEAFFQDYLQKKAKNPFGEKIEKNSLKYETKVSQYVKEYYGEIYSLHEMLEGKTRH